MAAGLVLVARRFRGSCFFAIYCLALFVVLGEVAVRLSGYSDHHMYDQIYETFDHDSEIPYVHKPNLRNARAWGSTTIDTDAMGLRSAQGGEPSTPKAAGEYRIAILGDSVTFGEGVTTADTFCEQLQRLLNRAQSRVHVRVFNFGVSAYSVKQMAATLERRALAIEPDLVVTVIIPADFDVGRTGMLDDWGYIRFDESGRHSWLKHVLQRSHLIYLIRDVYERNSGGWPSPTLRSVPDSYRYVTRIRDVCVDRHLDCRLVLVSTKIDDGFGSVGAEIERSGFPVLDLSTLRDEFTPEQFNAGRYDPHPSAPVHHRIAERLAAWILASLPAPA